VVTEWTAPRVPERRPDAVRGLLPWASLPRQPADHLLGLLHAVGGVEPPALDEVETGLPLEVPGGLAPKRRVTVPVPHGESMDGESRVPAAQDVRVPRILERDAPGAGEAFPATALFVTL
jgi:hypothetical protein